MTDDELISRFEDCTLASESFHHADHVRMAFLYLSRYPALEALQRFSASLVRFAAAKGKPGLYHETITWAYLLLIHERMQRLGGCRRFEEFARANPDLLTWRPSILDALYRPETLASELARRTFDDRITSIFAMVGECSGKMRSTPWPNDTLRTVNDARVPPRCTPMTTPSNT